VTLFQRIFLDLTATRYLDDCQNNNGCSQVSPEHHQHEVPVAPYDFRLLATLGVRLIFN
jgi:hypothetical protein